MRHITKIIRVEKRYSKEGDLYFNTYAIAGGDEVRGYSDNPDEYKVGDEVECFFDDSWNVAKMQKPTHKEEQ